MSELCPSSATSTNTTAQTISTGESDIYDEKKVSEYASIKSNSFKHEYEEPSFWKVLGDLRGKKVLDLACGSGHYTRVMQQKGVEVLVGVDISEPMIQEAKREQENYFLNTGNITELNHAHEISNNSNNIQSIEYLVADASTFQYNYSTYFDAVAAQYLLCYADTVDKLTQFCRTVYSNLNSGGRFVTVTGVLDQTSELTKGCEYKPVKRESIGEGGVWKDGIEVLVTITSDDGKSTCSFPNFLWKLDTIKQVLVEVGFNNVEVCYPLETVKWVVVLSASKF